MCRAREDGWLFGTRAMQLLETKQRCAEEQADHHAATAHADRKYPSLLLFVYYDNI